MVLPGAATAMTYAHLSVFATRRPRRTPMRNGWEVERRQQRLRETPTANDPPAGD